jgi:dTDP-4-dehydrorhamnose reductase
VKALLDQGIGVIATGKGECRLPFNNPKFRWASLDFTDAHAVQALISTSKPKVVVHSGAMTQVDPCELDPKACRQANVEGTRYVMEAAKALHAHFIFLSTDFVFDGSSGPYVEEDAPAPLSEYGMSKWVAERNILDSPGLHWAIIRTVLVYGTPLVGTRSNIISWVRSNLEAGKSIQVVSDQWRTPTYVGDLADSIIQVIRAKAQGIYHVSGKDFMSPYEMALRTARLLNLNEDLISKVDASTFTQPGKRPARTGFIIDKARRELGYEPINFEEGIRRTLGLHG